MTPLPRLRSGIILAAAVAALLAAGGGWWLCDRSDSIAFLPARAGAAWVVDAAPPENIARPARPVAVVFKRQFVLTAPANDATLAICAFRSAAVTINGEVANNLACSGKNWKTPTTAGVSGFLRAGTNEIAVSVTNDFGPPAVWLRLRAGAFLLGSDETWVASPIGSHWLNARRAAAAPALLAGSPLNQEVRVMDSLGHAWPALLGFSLVSAGVIFGVRWGFKARPAEASAKMVWRLFAVVILVRTALFFNDVAVLSAGTGFDAKDHQDYIRFIQEKRALPLPNDGWEMHQPPLYYLGCALWLDALGIPAAEEAAVLPLRMVNGVIGLLECWLVLLCLRRWFPENPAAQAAGLLVGAFLPANLYLSLYVTNDPLAGLLVTLAFYLFLRWLEPAGQSPRLALGIGLALGAAVLTKLNSLLAVPVFLAAMGVSLVAQKKHAPRVWLQNIGLALLAFLLVCGWHYVRVWVQIGALPLPNSQTDPASAWWQEPGFRTAGYYLGFGHSLVSPVFSGRHSFADGMYATLWGDGLISGWNAMVFRPPWNYDLMSVSCLLALAPTALAVAGLLRYLRKGLDTAAPAALLVAGMILGFAAGMVFLTLHGPWLAHVKAFYALPALGPFCILIAAGWAWLTQKNRAAPTALGIVLLLWAFTAAGSFWIQSGNFEFWRSRALVELERQDPAAAEAEISQALQRNPADAASHGIRAEALRQQGKTGEAIQEYLAALNIQPAAPGDLNATAQILMGTGQDGAASAMGLASNACELTGFRQPEFVTTLAEAYNHAGRQEDARATAQIAWTLAWQNGDDELVKKNWELIQRQQPAGAQK